MDKIDDILERLKGLQPRLSHPEEMVERVMAKLPTRECDNRASSKSREEILALGGSGAPFSWSRLCMAPLSAKRRSRQDYSASHKIDEG